MSEVDYAYITAAQGKRSGKYRHIYGEEAKPDKRFLDIKNPLASGEGSYLTANHKFMAVAKASGGGPVYIMNFNKPGRQAANMPVLSVQKGKVLDMDFHPFIPNMIATASEDCSCAVSKFPMEGLIKSVTIPEVMLKGHGKKVALLKFNPCANSILASGSYDKTVKLWNIESQSCVKTYEGMSDNIYSLDWNRNGSQLACTSKDKKLHIFDPRTIEEVSSTQAFDGTKSSKVFWMANLGWIGATGFSKAAKRQIKFWDLKDLSKPVFSLNVDNTSSVRIPYYDSDSGVLFSFGKGNGVVEWSEIINDDKKLYPLGRYASPTPQKGGGFVPKKGLDVWKCEISRFLKLTKDSVIPIPLIVPRKAGQDSFQSDIYPDAFAGKIALSADNWLKGENKDPILMSLNPENRKDDDDSGAVFTKKKSYQELEKENQELLKRVKELEAKLGINNQQDEEKEPEKEAEVEAEPAKKEEDKPAEENAGGDAAAAEE